MELGPPSALFSQHLRPAASPADREVVFQLLLDRSCLPGVVICLVDQVVLAALHLQEGQEAVCRDECPPVLFAKLAKERWS